MSFTRPPLSFIGNESRWRNDSLKSASQKGLKSLLMYGGSGYCSYMIKQCINELGLNIDDYTIIYNDFDNYVGQLRNKSTLKHMAFIRDYIESLNIKKDKRLPDDTTQVIKDYLKKENEIEPIDVKTIVRLLDHQMTKIETLDELLNKKTFYNRTTYYPNFENIDDYLQNLVIEHMTWREIMDKYNDVKNTLYVLDPPYLSTFNNFYLEYNPNDCIDLLVLLPKLSNYIYFVSDKSFIPLLIDKMPDFLIYDKKISKKHRCQHHGGGYIDYMICK